MVSRPPSRERPTSRSPGRRATTSSWRRTDPSASSTPGAGNDVVCVVPGDTLPDYEELPSFTVQAGDGDDVIDSTALTADQASLFVPSSAGRDAFYGGPEQDQVTIPAVNGVPPVVDTEADVFVTGAGDDLVMSGSLGMPNPDVIDTGDGDDVVLYAGSGATGEGRVAGGRGRDALYPTAFDPIDPPDDPLPPGGVVFDARTGTATVAGAPYLTWTGIDDYQLGDIEQNHVTFLGSARPEHVTLSRGTVYVRLGGGDDSVSHYYPSLPDGVVFGGAGQRPPAHRRPGHGSTSTCARGCRRGPRRAVGARACAGFEDAEAVGSLGHACSGLTGPNRLGAVARKVVTVVGRAGADRHPARSQQPRRGAASARRPDGAWWSGPRRAHGYVAA